MKLNVKESIDVIVYNKDFYVSRIRYPYQQTERLWVKLLISISITRDSEDSVGPTHLQQLLTLSWNLVSKILSVRPTKTATMALANQTDHKVSSVFL